VPALLDPPVPALPLVPPLAPPVPPVPAPPPPHVIDGTAAQSNSATNDAGRITVPSLYACWSVRAAYQPLAGAGAPGAAGAGAAGLPVIDGGGAAAAASLVWHW